MIVIIESTHSLSTILITDRSSGWWATPNSFPFSLIIRMIRTQFIHSHDNEYNRFKREEFMIEHSSDLTDQLSLHHHHSSLSTQWSDLNNPSLLLISFHCSGWDWGWVWTWTIRVAIQISYASGAVVCEVHVTSHPSEFHPDSLSSFFSLPFHLLHKSVVSVMAPWSLYHQHLW